ncbi:AraC family transcriptional regulator [Phosphitispora fastidiosa]|uniref:AraC family transcriptional regulator n=1 Tax=Phosphitispora fastidiosa TaxID=2837202 RepID=UPI001E28A67D|nr:helix-turn-helix domain-containing protein [Phosphitispora fastidiosa]MBU7005990.1 AraC-like DNA-binding protein [Phosphitispora fastidiosa]
MKLYSTELFTEFPPDIPNIVKTYSSDKITILKARNVFSEPKGFGCYKFLLPARNMPVAVVEKKKYHLEQQKIFPVNPDQVHLFNEEKSVETFIPIFIQTDYMKEFSHLLSGKSGIFYNNGSFNMHPNISRLVFQFMEEAENKQLGYEFVLQSLNSQITVSLLRNVSNNLSNDSRPKEYSDIRAVKRAKEFLQSHLCSDFSLDDLASFVNYSPYHFIRIFKKHTGKTPFEYLTELKIEKAKGLLATKSYSISEVSFLCGFANRTHFSTIFKRMVGMTPSFYRNSAAYKYFNRV